MRNLIGVGTMMLVAVSILWCPPSAVAQSGRGWMDGFILHGSATKGAAGATVQLTAIAPRSGSGKLVTKANERGEYKFKEIPYGDYILRVSSEGCQTYEIEIYIMPDAHTRLHVRLKEK